MPSVTQVSSVPSFHIPHLHLTLGWSTVQLEMRLLAVIESSSRWMSKAMSDKLLHIFMIANMNDLVTLISSTTKRAMISFSTFISVLISRRPLSKLDCTADQALGPKVRELKFGNTSNNTPRLRFFIPIGSPGFSNSTFSFLIVLPKGNVLMRLLRLEDSSCKFIKFRNSWNLISFATSSERQKSCSKGVSSTRDFGLTHLSSSFTRLGAYIARESGAFDTVHRQLLRCKRWIFGCLNPPTPTKFRTWRQGKQSLTLSKSSSSSLINSNVNLVSIGIWLRLSTDSQAFFTSSSTRLLPKSKCKTVIT